MFLGWLKLMTSGSHDYYARRAEVTQLTIYTSRPNDSPWNTLFVSDDSQALKCIHTKLTNHSGSQLDYRALVFETLLDQVIDDSCLFLSGLACEIHKAVSAHSRRQL
jgi:hypothetical protein